MYRLSIRQTDKQRFVIVDSESNYELHYILPYDELKKGNFQKLLEDLENDLGKLEISSFGLKDTTLEEVFFTVAQAGAANVESTYLNYIFKQIFNNTLEPYYIYAVLKVHIASLHYRWEFLSKAQIQEPE